WQAHEQQLGQVGRATTAVQNVQCFLACRRNAMRQVASRPACVATAVRIFTRDCDIYVGRLWAVTSPFDPSPLASRIDAEAEVRDRDLGVGRGVSSKRARPRAD